MTTMDFINSGISVILVVLALYFNRKIKKLENDLKIKYYKKETLHAKRTEILPELNIKLGELGQSMRELTRLVKYGGVEKEEERIRNAKTSFEDFINYFNRNKIYLNTEISDQIKNIIEIYYIGYEDYMESQKNKNLEDDKVKEKYKNAMTSFDSTARLIEIDLMKDFQNILEVD